MGRLAVVIEDEPRIAALVETLLTRAGFGVLIAHDGEVGLRMVKKNNPDLVISDMLLPKMHGLDVCRAIRSNALLSHTKIIAMTAVYRKMKDRLETKGVHVDAFLEKPFDMNDFLSHVYRLFPEQNRDAVEEEEQETAIFGSEELVKARNAFRKQVPALVTDIAKVWQQYQDTPGDKQKLHQLHQAVRGLTGAASLHGFADFSRYAARMEHVINAIRENDGNMIQTQGMEIQNLLQRLALDPEVNMGKPISLPGESKNQTSESVEGRVQHRATVCLYSDRDQTVNLLAAGLEFFKIRVVRLENATDPVPEGIQLLAVDLSGPDGYGELLQNIEQYRLQQDEQTRIVAFGCDDCQWDQMLGELIHHGCWQVLKGPVDGYTIAEMLLKEAFVHRDPYRILILDDQSMGEHFQIMLQSNGILTDVLNDAERIQLHMAEFRPDLVLIGEGLGNLTSVSLIRVVRNFAPDLPVVAVVDKETPEMISQVMAGGGSDVMPMGISMDRMALSLTSRMACCRLNRMQQDRDAASGADRFPLFLEKLEEELKWARRSNRPMTVAIAGLDEIGNLNRQYGIAFTDRMVRAWVDMVRFLGGEDGLVGRVGGNRLGICFPKKSETETAKLLTELKNRYTNTPFLHASGALTGSLSIGLITATGSWNAMEMFEEGRKLFYKAQEGGGNRILSRSASN